MAKSRLRDDDLSEGFNVTDADDCVLNQAHSLRDLLEKRSKPF